MKCDSLQDLLDMPAAEVPEPLKAQLHAHIETCPACSRDWKAQRLLDASLQAWPVPPPPPGYSGRVLERTFEIAARNRRRDLGYGLGLAAVLVLGVAIGLSLGGSAESGAGYTVRHGVLVLQGGRPTTVGVSFDATSALGGVRFAIDLPAGMQLADRPDTRHVMWTGELRKGRNLLRLPVVARAGTDGLLVAELSTEAGSRTFRLHVVAERPASFGAGIVRRIGEVLGWQT